jgi:hypothetical protein
MDDFTLRLTANWNKLSVKTRRRWWNETDYGKIQANPELRQAVDAEISALATGCEKSTTEGAGDVENKG